MLLDLRNVQGLDAIVERSYSPSSFSRLQGDEYVVSGPVELSLRVIKDNDKYRLKGKIVTTVRRGCCRCLKSFDVPTTLDFDLRYLSQRVNAGGGEYEVVEEDLSTAFYEDDQIDLASLIIEQLHLAVPMKPLCKADCRGLCPVCGADWNSGTCDCDESWHDPRLSVLRSLFPHEADVRETGKD